MVTSAGMSSTPADPVFRETVEWALRILSTDEDVRVCDTLLAIAILTDLWTRFPPRCLA